jgi:hypothetical protein
MTDLKDLPGGLVRLMRRLTPHHKVKWNAPDYIEAGEWPDGQGDGREEAPDLEHAEAVSSKYTPDGWVTLANSDEHALLLDLDVPAWLIPSSTPGHSHLFVDLRVQGKDLWDFLDLAAKIGLVEEGYVGACKSRGMTSLRLPWIKKGEEPSTKAAQAGPF